MVRINPIPSLNLFYCENNQKWFAWNDYEAKVINQKKIEKMSQDNKKIYAISKLKSNGVEAGSP
ncbi:MAG: hypothetical protein O8C65_07910 [Candidatus Methanoperedens sp.]|nr:hypothetical protein [Candidatus Methanoperedens sp.]